MKLSIFAAAATLLSSTAVAQQAIVINSCPDPIYVQSYPYDGGKAGPLTTVQPGKSFAENFRSSGSVRAHTITQEEL